ncbi:carbohydrate ABC transporter permease [Phytoactinopolyspora limicola]|uniref:carbohydrate ABC transporter permease n=1 Tax=Phytoactinopolyspora limicola TaxID=2715536 RepID=UPI00140E0C6E|nr:carbohydrate ABC transporter permease [Phytoactinopolyspora limicola]
MTTSLAPPPGAPPSTFRYRTAAQVRRRRIITRTLLYLAAAAVALFSVFPLYWMAVTAIKPQSEIITPEPVWWPSEFVWDRFPQVLDRGFGRYLRNSLMVAVSTTIIGLIVATMAGYALARFRIPLRKYLALVVLATQLFPVVVLLIPLFIVMRNLGLTGSLWGLVVAYLAFITPLMIWILRGFFLSVPNELEEAALIDGCTRFGAMRRVILPLAGPGIAAVSIFAWIAAWNEFLFALTFVRSESLRTLPVGLAFFVEQERVDHGAIMAGSLLFTLPVVVFFLFVHKRLTTGLVTGAVKG